MKRNIQQLRHDLKNGPTHVFGDHCECNPAFCKLRLNSGSSRMVAVAVVIVTVTMVKTDRMTRL